MARIGSVVLSIDMDIPTLVERMRRQRHLAGGAQVDRAAPAWLRGPWLVAILHGIPPKHDIILHNVRLCKRVGSRPNPQFSVVIPALLHRAPAAITLSSESEMPPFPTSSVESAQSWRIAVTALAVLT